MFGRAAAYSTQTACPEFSATATAAVEFRSSSSWQVRNWSLAAIRELMAAPRSPLSSEALACPRSALYRSAHALEPSLDAADMVSSEPSTHTCGRLAIEPRTKTAANKTFVPTRMAQLVLQVESRTRTAINRDQSASTLRTASASAEEIGTTRPGRWAVDQEWACRRSRADRKCRVIHRVREKGPTGDGKTE